MAGYLLIVERSIFAEESWQALVADLGADDQLDSFTARQRLWGRGLSLLARGTDQRLQGLATLLARHGVTHWLLKSTPPKFAPTKISAIDVASTTVTFACATGEVVLTRGDIVLAILADLSGAVAEKGIKRLMLHHAYRGTTANAGFSAEELQLAILRGRPVLDLYLLTESYSVRAAVRFFPGRFNPGGLGEQASYSAAGNLRAVMELARSYAGEWHLHTDFGLVDLPGCQLKKDGTGTSTDKANLASLTRFGWLMSDLLATSSALRDAPVQPPLAIAAKSEIKNVLAGEPEEGREDRIVGPPPLPPPPDFEIGKKGLDWLKSQQTLTLVPIALILLIIGIQLPAVRAAFIYSVELGMLPALLSVFLGWQGLYALHRKRQIENIPTSKLRSMAMGLVELNGRAVRRYALVSPMSHTPCVWYRLSKFRTEENGTRRSLGSSDSGPLPFFLDDGTGRVLVLPEGANVRAQTHHEGPPSGGLLFATTPVDSDEHWVEEVIAEGTWLYLLGFARPLREAPASLKERLIERLRNLKQSGSLQRFDTDGDGKICEEEWAAARQKVEHELLAESLAGEQLPRQNGAHAAIGRPPHRGLPFIIAGAASELQIAGRYGLRAILLLAVALGLGVWAVSAWLEQYPL